MSYSIWIGCEKGGEVPELSLLDALECRPPSFPYDSMTGSSNGRHPGYSAWQMFCDRAGLAGLFYGAGGILRKHPGLVVLTPEMLVQIRASLEAWRSAHPDAVPGWDFDRLGHVEGEVDDGVRGRDGVLARLLWLEWWMAWALEHCERPAIWNY